MLFRSGLVLDNMLKVLEDYVGQFVGTGEVYKRCFMILVDQFQLFLQNLKDPKIKRPKNRMSDPCVDFIRIRLDEHIEKMYNVHYDRPMKGLYEAAKRESC